MIQAEVYAPDEWVIIKVTGSDPHYRVFGSWDRGLGQWRLNSGVVDVKDDDEYYYFFGHSGSIYQCRKDAYGINSTYNTTVLHNLLTDQNTQLIEEIPDIMNMDWII